MDQLDMKSSAYSGRKDLNGIWGSAGGFSLLQGSGERLPGAKATIKRAGAHPASPASPAAARGDADLAASSRAASTLDQPCPPYSTGRGGASARARPRQRSAGGRGGTSASQGTISGSGGDSCRVSLEPWGTGAWFELWRAHRWGCWGATQGRRARQRATWRGLCLCRLPLTSRLRARTPSVMVRDRPGHLGRRSSSWVLENVCPVHFR